MNKKQKFKQRVEEVGINNLSGLVTVVSLPSGGKELIVNSELLEDKIKYILNTYDDNLKHKYAKDDVRILQYLVY